MDDAQQRKPFSIASGGLGLRMPRFTRLRLALCAGAASSSVVWTLMAYPAPTATGSAGALALLLTLSTGLLLGKKSTNNSHFGTGSPAIAVWLQDWSRTEHLLSELGVGGGPELQKTLYGNPRLADHAWSLVSVLSRNSAASRVDATCPVAAGQFSWADGPGIEPDAAIGALVAFLSGKPSFEADITVGKGSAKREVILLMDFLRTKDLRQTVLSMVDVAAHRARSDWAARLRREMDANWRIGLVQLVSRLLLFELEQAAPKVAGPSPKSGGERANRTGAAQDARQQLAEAVRKMLLRMTLKVEALDLGSVLRDAAAAMRPELDANELVTVIFAEPNLPTITGDRAELTCAFMALIENSVDSINACEGGERTISITALSEGPDEVCVTIADTGGGLAPAARRLLFEPLFTTKPRNQGLGLTMCRDVIEAIGGEIDVVDRGPVGGLMLRVRLPADG